jgi:hypothetical protein
VITNGESGRSSPDADSAGAAAGPDHLAERLAVSRRLLAAADVSAGVRAKFHRRLTAICDATKVPGRDEHRCARRLDLLLADLRTAVKAAGPPRDAEPGEPGPHRAEQGKC